MKYYSIKFYFIFLKEINIIEDNNKYITLIITLLRVPEFYKEERNQSTNYINWKKKNNNIIIPTLLTHNRCTMVLPKSNFNLEIKLYQTNIGFKELLTKFINLLNSTIYNNSDNILYQPLLPSCMRSVNMDIPLLVQFETIINDLKILLKERNNNKERKCIACNQLIKDINDHYICVPLQFRNEVNNWNNINIIPINEGIILIN